MNNLTQGGQVFFQNMRMFADIFWKLMTVFFMTFCASMALIFYFKTGSYERYEAFVLLATGPFAALSHGIGSFLNYMGLVSHSDLADQTFMNFKMPDGSQLRLSQSEVIDRIAQPDFLDSIIWLLKLDLFISLVIGFMASLVTGKLLSQFGFAMTEKKVLRGTRLCEPSELRNLVKKKDIKSPSPFSLSKVPLPKNAETQHIWINGTTGSGKTVAMSELMSQVRAQGHRAIVYDIMGTFVGRFYRPGKDIILNPFDERSAAWNLWSECKRSEDYDNIASSQIPLVPGVSSQDPFWVKAARSLYSATARRLEKRGKADTETFLRYLLTSDLEKLRELLKDTEAESLVAKDLEKTALSVKATLTDYIKVMRFLKNDGDPFSIRDWVKKEDEDSWIFISSRADCHEILTPLISAWYDIAITSALSLSSNPDRRIFNFIDELPTLQYLPSLHKGMAQGRQKGLCFVLGTQDLSQLKVNYGHDNAKSIIGNANTKLILRTVDDAEATSAMFNQSEVQDQNQSVSYGIKDSRDGVSLNKQRHLQQVVLPSELQLLDDLEGYLKFPGNFPVTKIKLEYVNYPELNERLVPRVSDVDLLDDIENESDSDSKIWNVGSSSDSSEPITL